MSIYDGFMGRCLERIRAISQGDTLDRETMMGPQVSAARAACSSDRSGATIRCL